MAGAFFVLTNTKIMDSIQLLLKEMEQEAQTTRKMLSRIPEEKFSWKPHEKSMEMKALATHISEIPAWIGMVLTTEELDFATSPYQPAPIQHTADLMELLERSLQSAREQLEKAGEPQLLETWTLRNGADIYLVSSKYEMIRTCFCQIVHHRAQLGVYLRLNDIPIPGSYGPSADEQSF